MLNVPKQLLLSLAHLVADRYGWFHCSEKCCKDCPELNRCKSACPKLADKVAALRSDAKAKAKEEEEAKAAKDAPVIKQISQLWQRFGIARNLAKKSVEDVRDLFGYRLPAEKEVWSLECGEAAIVTSTMLPLGLYWSDVSKIIRLADLLGCSVDFLLCRTDVRELATETQNVSKLDTLAGCSWHPVSVEPPVGIKIIIIDNFGFCDDCVYLGDGQWSGRIDEYEPVRAWSMIPTDDDLSVTAKAQVAVGTDSWQSQNPVDYGTYVAYIQLPGSTKKMLRELLWTGEEWLLFGEKIADDVTVCSWIRQPEDYV